MEMWDNLSKERKLIVGLVLSIIVILMIFGLIAGGGIFMYFTGILDFIKNLFMGKKKTEDVTPFKKHVEQIPIY